MRKVGIQAIRRQRPRFDNWLTKLEHLKGGAHGKPQIQRVEFPLVSCSFYPPLIAFINSPTADCASSFISSSVLS